MKTKFPIIEFTLLALMAFIIAVSCSKPGTITKTVIRYDTITTVGYPIIEGDGFTEWEFGSETKDTVYMDKKCPVNDNKNWTQPCPPTVINARRIKNKVKDSYNYIGEINELKRSAQVKDSQIDSLNILMGKRSVGEQTNVGLKWYWLILIGIVIGVSGYQGIRSAITKKI